MGPPVSGVTNNNVSSDGGGAWAREIGKNAVVVGGAERADRIASNLSLAFWGIAILVVALGFAREVVVATIGDGTFLQEWRHFDLDEEANLPAWFSSGTMLLIAALAGLLAAVEVSSRAVRRGWILIAGTFVLLSLDEASSFHEALMDPLRDLLGVSGVFHYAWVIPAIPLLLLFGIWTLRLLRTLPKALRLRMVLAGVLFAVGAVGMEMVAGLFAADGIEKTDLAYRIEIMAEETFEITGLVLFATALINYAAASGIRIARRS